MTYKWKNFVKPTDEVLKKILTKEEYEITQQSYTEYPFKGIYWNHKEEGIYVDKISGEPLFSSKDKFDSSCGWPSFSKSIDNSFIKEIDDDSDFMHRIEVRSRFSDSHLGHMFDDGPLPEGIRYCINSASIKFIPKDKMVEEGYEDYLNIFEK